MIPALPTLAYAVELLLHELGARLLLQELHVLLELELSDLLLSAKGVVFPFDVVQFQLMLHTIALLLKRELVQPLLRFVQLLRAWLCCQTGATCFLLPKLVELPLHVMKFQSAIEVRKLCALVEFVDVFLLGRLHPLLAERVGRRPAGGRSQKHSGQQKTCSNGPERFHRLTSCAC